MRRSAFVWMAAPLLMAACETVNFGGNAPSDGFIAELPEGVIALVGPTQDLTAVRIDPVDGCYVYRHVGPVETTFLPLRAKNGRPICSQAPVAATPVTG